MQPPLADDDRGHPVDPCPVCDARPTILVALRHPVMRCWTEELLESEHGCWDVETVEPGERLVGAIDRVRPDLVVVDEVDFPDCCRSAMDRLAPERVIVVGPEPDNAYRDRALSSGAGGWLSRDDVGEALSMAMRAALGCHHDPCPPARPRTAATTPDAANARGQLP